MTGSYGSSDPNPNLTSVVGEGVTWIGANGLFIANAASLVSVSFPNLSQASAIAIDNVGEPLTLDFASLVTVNDSLIISANISR